MLQASAVVSFTPAPAGEFAPATLADEQCARLRRALADSVRRVCPRWLSAQADDIVQAALIKVVEVAADGAELHPGYLWRAAYSAVVDEIRRQRRRREVALDGLPEEPQRMHAADPERAAAGAEIGRAVQCCLLRLCEPRRLAVTLHLQGHTVPEAGRILGWSAKRVENLVYRGLADLRRCLASKGLKP